MKQTPFSTGRAPKLGSRRIVYLWLRSRDGFPLKGEAFNLKKERVQSAFYDTWMTKPQAAHEVDIELQLLSGEDIHALIHMYEQFLNADVIDHHEVLKPIVPTHFILFIATDEPINLETFEARKAEIQRRYHKARVTFTPETISNIVVALESEETIETIRHVIVKDILKGAAELTVVMRDGVMYPVANGARAISSRMAQLTDK